ncbi:MAG: glycosyltransferase family 4 protein [Spirochaetaceae bacterium]|nr:glycosyltransferase family 4 protein [Spirochaetaceae bacterium]
MRIAHIHSGVRGIASYALNLYKYFEKTGDNTLVVSEAKWTKQKIPVYEPKSFLLGGILPWARSIKEVEQNLLEFKPDILHHHHPSGRLDFNIKRFRTALGTPLICTFHMAVGSRKYTIDKVMNTFFRLTRSNFTDAVCYVAISKFVREQLIRIGGVPKERIVLLYAGVDPDSFKPVQYEPHDTLEILFVGQITPEKGIDRLIRIVQRLSEERKVRLSIIGNGTLKPILMKKTRNSSIINWVGFLNSPAKVGEFYAKSDVTVLPVRWDEAFSYIPVESLSSGTPVIASRLGGNPEIIQEGKTGHLFTARKYDELYDILKNAEIPKLWEMGAVGREYILEKHTLETFGAKYKSLYKNVITNPENLNQID